MKQKDIDEMYMRRCLQLAKNGRLLAKPNPMVGAVIVSSEGNIIGEATMCDMEKVMQKLMLFDRYAQKMNTYYAKPLYM